MKIIWCLWLFLLSFNTIYANIQKEDLNKYILSIYTCFNSHTYLAELELFIKDKEKYSSFCYNDGTGRSIGYGFNDICNNVKYMALKDAKKELRNRIRLIYTNNIINVYNSRNYRDFNDLIKRALLITDLEYNIGWKWNCLKGTACEYSKVYKSIFEDKNITLKNKWLKKHYIDYNKYNGRVSIGLSKRREEWYNKVINMRLKIVDNCDNIV